MEGEEECFWLFLLIWKDKSFAYIPLKKRDQNHVVHLENLFGELG